MRAENVSDMRKDTSCVYVDKASLGGFENQERTRDHYPLWVLPIAPRKRKTDVFSGNHWRILNKAGFDPDYKARQRGMNAYGWLVRFLETVRSRRE